MKKVLVIIAAALCVVSCRLSNGSSAGYANRTGLIAFAQDNIYNVASPYAAFQHLYCVHLYRTFTGSDADLQWFARFGKCKTTGDVITMQTGPQYAIRTNGLPFDTPGALYTVNGSTFLCTGDQTSLSWSVTSDKCSGVITVLEQSPSYLHCNWEGVVTIQDTKTEAYSYEFAMLKPWSFVNSPVGSYFPESFTNGDDYPVGSYRLGIYVNGVETDWVETSLNGTSTDTYKTSRDNQ